MIVADGQTRTVLVRDAMVTDVVSVGVDALAIVAARVLVERGVNSIPVLDGEGRVAGVVGIKDILRLPIPSHWQGMPTTAHPSFERIVRSLETTPVARIMARTVRIIREDRTLSEAAARMARWGIHPLIVVRDDGTLAGVISRADVVRCALGVLDERAMHSAGAGTGR